MQRRINRLFPLIVIMVFVLSCDSSAIFDEYKTVPNQWHKDSVMSFNLKSPDTTNAYNLFINLRNNNDYKYSNLYVIAALNFPNGKVVTDTLEYKMAAPNGELLGSGFSDVKESKLWYKGFNEPFIFSESGEYKIDIKQAMRENGSVNGVINLEGITDIGFRVESK